MNEKALRILEYPKIIDMLTGYASSPMGKDLCRNLMPSSDISEILQGQMETSDALTRVMKRAVSPSPASVISAALCFG